MPTPTTYTFTQQVDYSSILAESIRASSISVALDSIGTTGMGPSMVVSILFKDILSDADQTSLATVMAAYVNNAPLATIPSVVQVLGADTLTLCPFGAIINPANNAVTNCDIPLPQTMVLRGGIFFSPNSVIGDWISISVVDKDNVLGLGGTLDNPTILGNYVHSWYVMPGIENKVEDVSISQSLPQGLYMRITYTSVGSATISGVVNFIAYTGTP